MATKDLARTVIEGGRRGSYKVECHDETVRERSATRAFIATARRSPDFADAMPAPMRQTVRRSFADKLNPAYRFLDSRVGKSWDKTLAMLKGRFDDRTVPGRHLMHDHVLSEVRLFGSVVDHRGVRPGWHVDSRGMLRRSPPRWKKLRMRPPCDRHAVLAWLCDRKIGRRGAHLYWFVRVRSEREVVARLAGDKLRYVISATGEDASDVPFRQDKALIQGEFAFFDSLPEWAQWELLSLAPSSPHRRKAVIIKSDDGWFPEIRTRYRCASQGVFCVQAPAARAPGRDGGNDAESR